MPPGIEGHTLSARRAAVWTTHAGLAVVAALLVAGSPVPLVGSAVAWPLAGDAEIYEEPWQVAAKPSSPSVPSLGSPVAHPTIIADPPPTLPRHDRQGASRSRRTARSRGGDRGYLRPGFGDGSRRSWHTYPCRVDRDRWGDPVYVQRADGVQPDARSSLLSERQILLARIESERDHIAAGTQGADPSPPDEVLAWCEEELQEVNRRLRVLDQEGLDGTS